MSYLVVDFGTSSCRASIISREGIIISHSREAVEISIEGQSAEIDTDYVWAIVVRVLNGEIKKNPDERIDAVGVSSMLGYVFLDSNNEPLRSAVIWMDNRAVSEADQIRELFDIKELYLKTGRRLSPELLAPKLLWLRRNEGNNYSRIRSIIGLKDEIVRRLTGRVQTDFAHLNYTFLYNINSCEIDGDICTVLDINPDLFPEGNSADVPAGAVTDNAAGITGLTAGIPVVIGSSDGTTAMYGGGILQENKAVLVSGTTDVLMMKTNHLPYDLNCTLSINNGFLKNSYICGGAMGMTGGTLRRILKLFNWDYEETVNKVDNTMPGAEGLLFTPGLSGERAPYWAENFNCSLVGLGPSHRGEHIVRALFEGSSFRIARLLHIMNESKLYPEEINIVGGGAELDVYNQIRADITGLKIVSLKNAEATSLGTAMYCRSGIGDVPGLQEAGKDWVCPKRTYYPDPVKHDFYKSLSEVFETYIEKTMDINNSLKEGIKV